MSETTKQKFSKFYRIPSFVIRRVDDMKKQDILVNKNTLIPEILIRLQIQLNIEDECAFSIDNLINKCGYAPKTGKGKSIDLFRQALQIIQDYGFIYDISFGEGVDFSNVRTSTLLTCRYNEKLESNTKEISPYCTIDFDDYVKMTKIASGSALRNLINVYCYLSSRKLLSANLAFVEETAPSKKSLIPSIDEIKDMIKYKSPDLKYVNTKGPTPTLISSHKFGYTFATYDEICADITEGCKKTLSKTTLTSVLKQLADLEIIYYGNVDDYLELTSIKKPCNIYAFTEHGYRTGLNISFSRCTHKNSSKYPEASRKTFLRNLLHSLNRNEHHYTPSKDGEKDAD